MGLLKLSSDDSKVQDKMKKVINSLEEVKIALVPKCDTKEYASKHGLLPKQQQLQ